MKRYVDIDMVYPVGSIYMSVNNTNPSTLFGGEWEQIEDRFLLGAGSTYVAGSSGGEAEHTLTVNEMPSHNHYFETMENGTGKPSIPMWPESTNPATRDDWWHITWEKETELPDGFYPFTNWIQNISNTGDSQAHNNLPPYLAVYMWKRVA